MALETVKLIYGKGEVEFRVDSAFMAGPVVDTRKPGVPPRPALEAIAGSLKNPVGRPQLREMARGKVVGILISDEFRAGLQKEIASALIVEAAAGAPREIRVFVATGSHDPAVYAKNLKPFIEDCLGKVPVPSRLILHDCDKSELVEIGRTPGGTIIKIEKPLLECDLRVYGHEAKHHYMCGYSNMDKQIVPGVSSRITIEMNHKNSLDHEHAIAGRSPWQQNVARRFNPFAVDASHGRALSEAFWLSPDGMLTARRVDTYGLEMVSDKDKVYWINSGDPATISYEMTGIADSLAAYELQKTRYVMISPGGPPACTALYGVQNCFDMALKGAIMDGGEALVIAPCNGREDLPPDVKGLAPDAKSKALFWDNLVKMRDWPLEKCVGFIDAHFELYLWKTDRVLKLFKANNVKMYMYCDLPAELLASAGITKVDDIQKWVDERAKRGDGKVRVVNNGNKLLITPV
ncbi:MAG: lactate racemase domain-containing protein [Myxococcota bacterium]|jgi:nickel-dependent lactate racemase